MYLGIDLGTTSIKVILTNENLKCIATASAPLQVSRPQPLFSEQNPSDWWNGLNTVMLELRAKQPTKLKKVIAVGLSGQQHGAIVLDKHGKVLHPAILWNDGRSSQECVELMDKVPDATTIAGSVIMPGFTAPKLLWLKKYKPDIFKKIDKILLPKDYLRFLMSADVATDLSDASGTGWLNVQKRQWSSELLTACDLTIDQMPQLFEGNAITGMIQKSVAYQWGLSDNVKIAAGAGDNAASAMSMGCVNTNTVYLSLGTSATFFLATAQFQPNPIAGIHSFCHAVPDLWHDMAVHLNGASCVSWTTNLLNRDLTELMQITEKNHRAHSLLFVPYLSGERTPHNNPHATGAFFGLEYATQSSDIMQAVLEGVAFGLREGFNAMIKNPAHLQEMTVVGGGAKSMYWGKIIASILNMPLTYRQSNTVGAAFGAAKLAWLAETKSNPADLFSMPAIENVVEPHAEWVSEYETQYRAFQKLYRVNYR